MENEILKYSFQHLRRGITFNTNKNIKTELFRNDKIHPSLKKAFEKMGLREKDFDLYFDSHGDLIADWYDPFHCALKKYILHCIFCNNHILVRWTIDQLTEILDLETIYKIILSVDEKMLSILNNKKFFTEYDSNDLIRLHPSITLCKKIYKCEFKYHSGKTTSKKPSKQNSLIYSYHP